MIFIDRDLISTFDILSVMIEEKIFSVNKNEESLLKNFKLSQLCDILNNEERISRPAEISSSTC